MYLFFLVFYFHLCFRFHHKIFNVTFMRKKGAAKNIILQIYNFGGKVNKLRYNTSLIIKS